MQGNHYTRTASDCASEKQIAITVDDQTFDVEVTISSSTRNGLDPDGL